MNEFETQTHQESPTAPFDINAYKTARHWTLRLFDLLLGMLALVLMALCACWVFLNICSQSPFFSQTAVHQACNGDESVCLQAATAHPRATLLELANTSIPPGSASRYLVRISVTPIKK
ncbi:MULTISPECIES: hypothetical protein [Pseudomonas syringae group genomosp. 2]|uniref:Stability determinant n=2 Tax=Pseudomonas syringae group genomosp. 2 TaxID=251698 RepID=A0A3M6AQG8_PSESS|nr:MULTISPECIES: hypothetical protein [Pseudomonas syringae group genomosp. 2]KPX10982.1 hypothetical protein ALO74_200134 [Pseudomonas syringae pv. cunninghamiae]KPX26096.1 hypothetical protein ALO70_200227 [Pseudomonas amygdali pv. eriobotryae]KWS75102.1 hypothetical protein AL052_09510 [Pseudomonas amygdali pv. eriobotryae]RML99512.1 hypothetical protein ALQ86_200146 [Pseudomonas amygdali pv. eriobotryae]RMO52167.1 hypothetical protein ALQ39_200027 [Pseudomonas amygdali pv. eriobotryae]